MSTSRLVLKFCRQRRTPQHFEQRVDVNSFMRYEGYNQMKLAAMSVAYTKYNVHYIPDITETGSTLPKFDCKAHYAVMHYLRHWPEP